MRIGVARSSAAYHFLFVRLWALPSLLAQSITEHSLMYTTFHDIVVAGTTCSRSLAAPASTVLSNSTCQASDARSAPHHTYALGNPARKLRKAAPCDTVL